MLPIARLVVGASIFNRPTASCAKVDGAICWFPEGVSRLCGERVDFNVFRAGFGIFWIFGFFSICKVYDVYVIGLCLHVELGDD